MEISVSKEGLDPEWDEFLETLPDNLYQQSSLWAMVKAGGGWKHRRLVVRENGKIIGGVQMLLRPLPFHGFAGYVSKGPVVDSKDSKVQELILDQLDQFAKRERVFFLKVQPAFGVDSLAELLDRRGTRRSSIGVTPRATLRIDLRPDADEILARMKGNTRRNIRKAERKGLTVRLGQETDIGELYSIAKIHAKMRGYNPFPIDYYHDLWSILGVRGHFCFFVAEYERQIIAAQTHIVFGDTLLEYHLVDNGLHRELNAQSLLHWEAILWAKDRRYSWYDFGGIKMQPALAILNNEPLPDTRAGRVAGFKKSFGGQLMLRPDAFDISYVWPKTLTVRLVPTLIKIKPLVNILLGRSLSEYLQMHDKATIEDSMV